MRNLRAAYRAVAGVGFLLGTLLVALPLQAALINPFLKKYDHVVPRLVGKGVCKLFGIQTEFNKASAPIEKKRQAIYVANHMAPLDPPVLATVLKGHFVAAGWISKFRFINAFGKAAKVMFISQKKDETSKKRDRGQLVATFNDKQNVIVFPEGWTNDGTKVYEFRAGLTPPLYGGDAINMKGEPVSLQNKDIVVQPVAMRVKSVDGQDALGDPLMQEPYSMGGAGYSLKDIWRRLGYKNITLELTAFPPLDPKDFPDGKGLMNEAHRQITALVAPDQTVIEKAPIKATEGEKKTKRPMFPWRKP